MNLLRKAPLLFRFYTRTIPINLVTTISGLILYAYLQDNRFDFALVPMYMFWLKAIGYLFIAYLLNKNTKEMYFYYNLGLSKRSLFYSAFLFDALLFFVALQLLMRTLL